MDELLTAEELAPFAQGQCSHGAEMVAVWENPDRLALAKRATLRPR